MNRRVLLWGMSAALVVVTVGAVLWSVPSAEPLRIEYENSENAEVSPEADGTVSLKIELNTATAADLLRLPDCTPEIAQAILDYRGRFGYYCDIHEVHSIAGVTDALWERWKPFLTVELDVENLPTRTRTSKTA